MNKDIILISRCEGLNNSNYWRFFFRGYLKGQLIKEVFVQKSEEDLVEGVNYLMQLNIIRLGDGTVECKMVKYKKVSEFSLV